MTSNLEVMSSQRSLPKGSCLTVKDPLVEATVLSTETSGEQQQVYQEKLEINADLH